MCWLTLDGTPIGIPSLRFRDLWMLEIKHPHPQSPLAENGPTMGGPSSVDREAVCNRNRQFTRGGSPPCPCRQFDGFAPEPSLPAKQMIKRAVCVAKCCLPRLRQATRQGESPHSGASLPKCRQVHNSKPAYPNFLAYARAFASKGADFRRGVI
jgi:hypothetical protein